MDNIFQNDHENIPKQAWNRQRNTTDRENIYKQLSIKITGSKCQFIQTLELHIFIQWITRRTQRLHTSLRWTGKQDCHKYEQESTQSFITSDNIYNIHNIYINELLNELQRLRSLSDAQWLSKPKKRLGSETILTKNRSFLPEITTIICMFQHNNALLLNPQILHKIDHCTGLIFFSCVTIEVCICLQLFWIKMFILFL